jgi:hypothetical protein
MAGIKQIQTVLREITQKATYRPAVVFKTLSVPGMTFKTALCIIRTFQHKTLNTQGDLIMLNSVLELRGRVYQFDAVIKGYVKQAAMADTMQEALVIEVKITGLEDKRKTAGKKLLVAEHESKQMLKEFNRKPYLKGRK